MLKRIKFHLFCAEHETGEFVTLRMLFLNNMAVTDRDSAYGQGRLTASYLVTICHVWDDLRIIHIREDRNLDWMDCPPSKKKNSPG